MKKLLSSLYADVVADGGDGLGACGERGGRGVCGGRLVRGVHGARGAGPGPRAGPPRAGVEHFALLSGGRRGPPSVDHVLDLHVQHAREQEPEYRDDRHPHAHGR